MLMKVADEKASVLRLFKYKELSYKLYRAKVIYCIVQAKLRVTRKNEIIDEALVGDELTR